MFVDASILRLSRGPLAVFSLINILSLWVDLVLIAYVWDILTLAVPSWPRLFGVHSNDNMHTHTRTHAHTHTHTHYVDRSAHYKGVKFKESSDKIWTGSLTHKITLPTPPCHTNTHAQIRTHMLLISVGKNQQLIYFGMKNGSTKILWDRDKKSWLTLPALRKCVCMCVCV